MHSQGIFVTGALLAVVSAVPMVRRDVVWVTETEVTTAVVPVIKTIFVSSGESAPTSAASDTLSHYGHHRSRLTSTVQSTVTVSAASSGAVLAPSSTSSVYVAPETSQTSVYVAPTTSTSVYVAPTTSTSIYVAPTTSTSTSVYVAPTTSTSVAPAATTAAAAPAKVADTTSAKGTTYTGDITHYDVGLGSCGWTNTDAEAIVAIPHGMMKNGVNPNNNPLCGKMITISYAGATHQAKVVDTCGGCDGASIDLSPALFTAVAPSGDGRVHNVNWWFT